MTDLDMRGSGAERESVSSAKPEPSVALGRGAEADPADVQPTRSGWVLTLCFLITALNVMDRQVLAITASAIQAEFDLSDGDLGLLTGFAFVVMHVIVGIPVSWLADRSSRRNVIAFGVIAWSALTAATGLARSYAQIFLARVGVGVGEAVGSGPVQSLLADYFPVERRGSAYAVNGSGGNLGAFVALLLGGYLVDALGWRATFFVFGAPGLVVALLLLLTVKEPPRKGVAAGSAAPLLQSIRLVAGVPTFRYLTLSASFNQFTNYGFLFFLPTAMMRLHGLDAGEAGSKLALAQAAPTFVGVLASGWLVDRLGRRDPRWHLRVPALASLCAGRALPLDGCSGPGTDDLRRDVLSGDDVARHRELGAPERRESGGAGDGFLDDALRLEPFRPGSRACFRGLGERRAGSPARCRRAALCADGGGHGAGPGRPRSRLRGVALCGRRRLDLDGECRRAPLEKYGDALEAVVPGEPDLPDVEASHEGRDGLARDEAGEARSDAMVRASGEGEMSGEAAVESERVRVLEDRLVPVRRGDTDEDTLSGADRVPRDLRGATTHPHQEEHGRVESKRFFDRGRDVLRALSKARVELGMLEEP